MPCIGMALECTEYRCDHRATSVWGCRGHSSSSLGPMLPPSPNILITDDHIGNNDAVSAFPMICMPCFAGYDRRLILILHWATFPACHQAALVAGQVPWIPNQFYFSLALSTVTENLYRESSTHLIYSLIFPFALLHAHLATLYTIDTASGMRLI